LASLYSPKETLAQYSSPPYFSFANFDYLPDCFIDNWHFSLPRSITKIYIVSIFVYCKFLHLTSSICFIFNGRLNQLSKKK